jgi:four helix bundle protein
VPPGARGATGRHWLTTTRMDSSSANVKQATGNRQWSIKGDDIARRLLVFAVRVLDVVRKLRTGAAARHVARQLLRSATAGGANYEESRAAESRADFVHKVSIAAKELREARYWLRLTRHAELAPADVLDALVRETNELVAILTASAKTAKRSSSNAALRHS